tara:strand:- start:8157 stop:9884 length:1728 start_codon:yes stop_codon:yes gene_type:complete
MNLFLEYQKKIINCLNLLKKEGVIELPNSLDNIIVELPPKISNAEISCNAGMVLSKINRKSPIEISNLLKNKFLNTFKEFKSVEVAKPGFLNITFKIEFWRKHLLEILKSDFNYGSTKSHSYKYNIEFVSANPTGPLHVGHCRGAVLGDALSNLLKFNGHTVTKEYYVNDYGNQIKIFVSSVYYRILEIQEKKKFPDDKELYPGEYIIDIAKQILKDNPNQKFSNYEKVYEKLKTESLNISIQLIKNDLKKLGVNHDIFIYESDLVKKNFVSKIIKKLEKEKFVYTGKLVAPKGEKSKDWKSRNQLLFASTKFGDEIDRALQKEDLTWTYFASDIAYHGHKIERSFDLLINILGADHSGYITRIKSAVKALSKNKIDLICKVSQLVKLFKSGKPFKMSKRKGDYITLEDLINEVGKDSVRFMMLNRNSDVELDFDFEKVAEKSKENPVFYVQYANARINSIFRTLKININKKINLPNTNFDLNEHEIEILKKISEWPKCVGISAAKLEPHRIPFYLYELVTLFHSYWNLGNENKKFRFINDPNEINYSRLLLLQALFIVIRNGLSILGVTAPDRM